MVLFKYKRIHIILVILVIAAFAYFIASTGEPSKPVTEKKFLEKTAPKKIYNYTPGERPDYGLSQAMFRNLPPLPPDFWEVDEKFYQGGITDFVELGDEYYRQPEFYPTFEDNIEFIKNPQGGRIYAFGIGAYPGDIGAEVPPDSIFTVATFFHSSWLVETHQGVKLEAVYPERTDILNPDLQDVNFTVKQEPSKMGKYFNVTFDPELFVLGPTAPVFDENWTLKVKINVTVDKEAPKGTYVIGVNPVVPSPEYSELWLKTYEKYSDAAGFRIGRPSFQLVVFVT